MKNLSKLVEMAKGAISNADVISLCDETQRTDTIPKNILKQYAESKDQKDWTLIASFCPADVIKKWFEQGADKNSDENFLARIALNPDCDKKMFLFLINQGNTIVNKNIAQNKSASEEILMRIAKENYGPYTTDVLLTILDNPNCSKEVRRVIWHNECANYSVRNKIMEVEEDYERIVDELSRLYPYISADGLYYLESIMYSVDDLRCLSYSYKSLILQNTDSSEVLKRALREGRCFNWELSVAINNENVALDDLKWLVEHGNLKQKKLVASKKNAPLSLLRILSDDGSKEIREEVAKNENAPKDVLDSLSYDSNDSVRLNVCRNLNTSDDTLFRLFTSDKEAKVRREAAQHLSGCKIDMSSEYDSSQLCGLLQNENSEKDFLNLVYGKSKNMDCLLSCMVDLVYNKNADDSIFERVIDDIASINDKQKRYYDDSPILTVDDVITVILTGIIRNLQLEDFKEFIKLFFKNN